MSKTMFPPQNNNTKSQQQQIIGNNNYDQAASSEVDINYEIGTLIDKVATAHSRSKQRSNSTTKQPRKIKLAEPVEATIDKQIEDEIYSYPFISNDNLEDDQLQQRKFSMTFSGGGQSSTMTLANEVRMKKQKELVEKISFSDQKYQSIFSSSFPLKPLVPFFKHLVSIPTRGTISDQHNIVTKSKLRISLPYTVVFGIAESPVLYYSDVDGYVVRVDNVSFKTIKQKLTLGTTSDSDVAVVMKRLVPGEVTTNVASLLSVKQLLTILDGAQNNGVCVFQRYVKSSGSKASVARIIWNSTRPISGFVLSNKRTTNDPFEKEASNRLLTNTENANTFDIFQLKAAALGSLGVQMNNIVKYLESLPKLKCKFQTFAADFIRDDDGRYWFIQAKAFTIEEKVAKLISDDQDIPEERNIKAKSYYLKSKECKMCLNLFPPNELSYSMTVKMIYATEQHLKRRAVKLAWFDRPEFKGTSETSSWYQESKVCKPCFDMYLQEQKLAKVELQFAKAIGIPVTKKINDDASILESLQHRLSNQKRNNCDTKGMPKTLLMYRFIVYLNEVRNIPDTLMSAKKVQLKAKIFDTELIVPLRMEDLDPKKKIALGKLRVFYFFIKNQSQFRLFLKNQREIKVDLCVNGNEVIGKAVLNLKQFESGLLDKLDYMVLFSATGLKLCSLRATIGFVQMSNKDITNIKLTECNSGVYIPPSDFYTADPLPDEWMEMIPTLKTTREGAREIDESKKRDRRPQVSKPVAPSSAAAVERRPFSATLQKRPTTPSQTLTRRAAMSATPRKTATPSYAKSIGNLKKRPASASSHGQRQVYNGSQISDYYDSTSSTTLTQDFHTIAWDGAERSGKTQSTGIDAFLGNVTFGTDHTPEVYRPASEARLHFAQDELIWEWAINQFTVKDLKSSVDECWILRIDVFGVIKKEYESFQIFNEGPLVFDIEDRVYLSASRENLGAFFEKERIMKISLKQKYSYRNELVAFFDLRQLLKRENAQIFLEAAVADSSHAEEIRCGIVGSDDSDQESDEEEEKFNRDELKLGTISTYVCYTKMAKTNDVATENVEGIQIEDYSITCFKTVPDNWFDKK